MEKKTLKKILLTGALGLLTFFPNLSNGNANIASSQIPQSMSQFYDFNENGMVKTFKNKKEGEKKIKEHKERMNSSFSNLKTPPPEGFADFSLNYFLPGWKSTLTDKNWYGSGDMDGDNDIDEDDYTYSLTQPVSFDPFHDGTHRADLNMNGQSYDSEDIQILWEFIQGERTHINVWELETAAEQESHFRKALAIDPTNLINANVTNWLCYNYTSQLFINFNGSYDITNSDFARDNGTQLQYDLSHNGIFRIPLKFTSTYTGSGVPHEINVAYISRIGNENVRDFYYKIYVEPQTDEIQSLGDFSLNRFAKEFWYGFYENIYDGWKYGSVNLGESDLSSGQAIDITPQINLVESFNALAGTTFLPNKTLQYYPGIEEDLAGMVQTELPLDIPYPDYTFIERSSSHNQETEGARKYNFEFKIETYLRLGKFESNTSLGGINVQTISVEDTEPPTYNPTSKTWSDASGSPVIVYTKKDTINQSCDGLVGLERVLETGTDVSQNSKEEVTSENPYDIRVMPTYVSSPSSIEYIGNPNGPNPTPSETGAPVWSHPTGNVVMHYSDRTTRESYGEKDIERTYFGTSTRSDCERSRDTIQMIYVRSGVGVDDIDNEGGIKIYPNPAKEFISISWDGTREGFPFSGNPSLSISDLTGRIVYEKEIYTGNIQINTLAYSTGIYLLKIHDDRQVILQRKIVIQ